MADLCWPGGVPFVPLLQGYKYRFRESEYQFTAEAADPMGGPKDTGLSVLLTGIFPMSRHQYRALFLPWWTARKVNGGCDKGTAPFWAPDPETAELRRWCRLPGTSMDPEADGFDVLVGLSLYSLPAGAPA